MEDCTHNLVVKLAAALDGEDMDDVIPALVGLMARAGSTVCSDRDVFVDYVVSVIDQAYEGDGETLQ
jgi:hypothetical protein